ncbi:unnamed protein product [Dibothriocephalus latus]|uniref:Uncharacterized protein n=1 Tax=Dibothriocephalus latus TaxID=60516 RepID=A0A3P7MZQ3_DIBLA|nr:unnamed protein product [Dibothriocephalus latus]
MCDSKFKWCEKAADGLRDVFDVRDRSPDFRGGAILLSISFAQAPVDDVARLVIFSEYPSKRFTVEMSTLDDEARRLDETAASHELELMRMTDKKAELEERLARAERNLTMAMDKVTHSKPKAQLDISVQLLCDFNESLNMLLVRCIRGSPFVTEEVLKRAQELFDSFQLATPILVGNMANIRQSERVMQSLRNTNASSWSIVGLKFEKRRQLHVVFMPLFSV